MSNEASALVVSLSGLQCKCVCVSLCTCVSIHVGACMLKLSVHGLFARMLLCDLFFTMDSTATSTVLSINFINHGCHTNQNSIDINTANVTKRVIKVTYKAHVVHIPLVSSTLEAAAVATAAGGGGEVALEGA